MKHFHLLLLAAFCFFWVSCSRHHAYIDGDWPPMKWETVIPHFDSRHIAVSAAGDSLAFKCTNYGFFWANYFIVDKQYIDEDSLALVRLRREDATLTVIVDANPKTIVRIFDLELEAGDAFDTFRFEQAAKRE